VCDKRESRNVSRVLLSLARRRLSIWVVCYQVPQADLNRNREKTNHCSCLASNRGLPSQYLSILLVRSYRTFAPLPVRSSELGVRSIFSTPNSQLLTPHYWRYFSVALSSRSLALGITQQVWSFGSPDFPRNSTSELATTSPTLSQLLIVQGDRVFYRCESRHSAVLIVGVLSAT
jgi:hypothetical protein